MIQNKLKIEAEDTLEKTAVRVKVYTIKHAKSIILIFGSEIYQSKLHRDKKKTDYWSIHVTVWNMLII